MSRVYRVRISDTLEQVVHVADGVTTKIDLIPILPKEQMSNLLAQELLKKGFKQSETSLSRLSNKGVNVSLDMETGEVKVSISHNVNVQESASADFNEDTDRVSESDANRRAREQIQAQLQQKVEKRKQELQQQTTSTLEKELKELRQEMDEVINSVTSAALKIRASQLGDIEDIKDDNEGNITIKVRV